MRKPVFGVGNQEIQRWKVKGIGNLILFHVNNKGADQPVHLQLFALWKV